MVYDPEQRDYFSASCERQGYISDKLDATIGGHVEPGASYDETALKEAEEETGIKINPSNLRLVKKMFKKSFDEVTKRTNNTIRSQYVYLFDGKIEDLRIEPDKALGFEAWKIDSLHNLNEEDKHKFIPMILSKEFLDLFEEGQKLLGLK